MQVQLLGSLNGRENWYLARPSGFFRVSGWPTGCLVDLLYCSVCSSRCPAATATLTTHIKSRKQKQQSSVGLKKRILRPPVSRESAEVG